MSWWRRWLRPASATPGTRDEVAPDLTPELLERVKAIELKARKIVDELLLGQYHAVFRGLGLEFDELRPYVPGDDVRDIDWKTFARSGQPVIRRYREDRDLTVLFLVDVSASMRAGSLAVSKADVAAEICAVLALAAIRNNDRVGLLLFASGPERYVRPASGAKHVLRVVREVLRGGSSTAGTNVDAALEYLTGVQRRRATIFLLSDFLTVPSDQAIRAVASRHDLIAIRLREPGDGRLHGRGIVRARDAETGFEIDIDAGNRRVREVFAAHFDRMDEERAHLFGELGIDEIPVIAGEDYVPALLRFFRRRSRAAAS